MILPDVNVLLYAFRRDLPEHEAYRAWLDAVVSGEMAYGMSPQVFVERHPDSDPSALHLRPSQPHSGRALAFASLLLDQPHCQIVQPGPRHWGIFRDLCRSAKAVGNLVQDAWLAALAMESGCGRWVTYGSRFRAIRRIALARAHLTQTIPDKGSG